MARGMSILTYFNTGSKRAVANEENLAGRMAGRIGGRAGGGEGAQAGGAVDRQLV